jgi:hypothetical protein
LGWCHLGLVALVAVGVHEMVVLIAVAVAVQGHCLSA